MTETLVDFFINTFANLGKEIVIFIISLMPILELRGGLLAASLLKVPFIRAFIICLIGNILPIPLLLLLLEKIFNVLKKWKLTKKIALWLEKKSLAKSAQIKVYGYFGLLLFVGIPLPGTGGWTGSLIAVLLGLNKKKSFIYISIGILMAGIIMSIISYGILGNIW